MVNFDQAEGLRRMLFCAKPRIVTFLSALDMDEKNATMINLSTGLGRIGQDVVLLDARRGSSGTGTAGWLGRSLQTTLLDVAEQNCTIQQALLPTDQGIRLARLCH